MTSYFTFKSESESFSLVRLLWPCPWNSPGKNTGVGCHFLLQGIFPTQGSNPCFLHLANGIAGSLPLSHLGRLFSKSPKVNANFYVNVTWGPKTLDDLSIGKRWHVSVLRFKPRTESKTSVLWSHKPCLKMEDRVFSTLNCRYENQYTSRISQLLLSSSIRKRRGYFQSHWLR